MTTSLLPAACTDFAFCQVLSASPKTALLQGKAPRTAIAGFSRGREVISHNTEAVFVPFGATRARLTPPAMLLQTAALARSRRLMRKI
ncbi:hypothetical protein [Bradyrhizobium canariense]|uniref:hypothetical protein n=1 Tax=Bradyrhizobium canariense TaxID=255045 RepID=UPI0011BADBD7|nr:hypothetical protein [Bradyrhizobium canariense]